MASLDDGVTNLQRLLANPAMATSAIETSGEHFKGSGERFAQMEDEAGDDGDGLNDQLEELGSALDTRNGDAHEALTDLTQAATEAQHTTGEAQTKVEDAASALEEKTQTIMNDLDEAHGHLTDRRAGLLRAGNGRRRVRDGGADRVGRRRSRAGRPV